MDLWTKLAVRNGKHTKNDALEGLRIRTTDFKTREAEARSTTANHCGEPCLQSPYHWAPIPTQPLWCCTRKPGQFPNSSRNLSNNPNDDPAMMLPICIGRSAVTGPELQTHESLWQILISAPLLLGYQLGPRETASAPVTDRSDMLCKQYQKLRVWGDEDPICGPARSLHTG